MTRADAIRDDIVREVQASGFGAHGVHVLAGDDEAAHRFAPDVREEVHSLAKTVGVIAAAMAADDGLVDLDAPVSTYLPDLEYGDGTRSVTLRHLLTMTSGIDLPWSPTLMTDWPDLAREFLRRPTRGRTFQYSNASTYTAMRALGAVVGDVDAWLTPRLFDPLGIGAVEWQRCPNGWILGAEGLSLRTAEVARLGRLLRDGGVWHGERLVQGRWIDDMHRDWVDTGDARPYDRYALSGWAGPGRAWRLHGAHGQLVLFVDDIVVTVTAHDHFGADAFAARVVAALDA
jgi:CubicO group peptidase (beta-lactamase class C family)